MKLSPCKGHVVLAIVCTHPPQCQHVVVLKEGGRWCQREIPRLFISCCYHCRNNLYCKCPCSLSICLQFFGGHVVLFTGRAISIETSLQSLHPGLSRGQQSFFNSSMSSVGMATDELVHGWGWWWVRAKHTLAFCTGFNGGGPLISIPNGSGGVVREAEAEGWSGCAVSNERHLYSIGR